MEQIPRTNIDGQHVQFEKWKRVPDLTRAIAFTMRAKQYPRFHPIALLLHASLNKTK
jgi:hypothetical protein